MQSASKANTHDHSLSINHSMAKRRARKRQELLLMVVVMLRMLRLWQLVDHNAAHV